MEKTISIRNTEVMFSIWDLGGMDARLRAVFLFFKLRNLMITKIRATRVCEHAPVCLQ